MLTTGNPQQDLTLWLDGLETVAYAVGILGAGKIGRTRREMLAAVPRVSARHRCFAREAAYAGRRRSCVTFPNPAQVLTGALNWRDGH